MGNAARLGVLIASIVMTCAASSHAQQQQQQQQTQPPPYYPPPPQQPQPYYPPQQQQYYQQPQQPYYNGPEEMKYRDGDPIPPGYHVDTRMRKGLVIAGSVITGVPWLIGLPTALGSETSADRWLLVPVIGPWGDYASRPKCQDTDTASGAFDCVGEGLIRALLVLDGILQTTGAILFTVGIAAEKTVLVRNDVAIVHETKRTVKFLPSRVGPNAFGLTAFGEF